MIRGLFALSLALLPGQAWAGTNPPEFILQWGSNGAGDGQFSGPHGIEVNDDGDVYVADTGNNRILRIDPATGASTVITTAVSTALGLAVEPSGSLLTVEYRSGRLLRIAPAGSVSVAARGLRKPYALARAATGTVYVTEAGELNRPTGTIRRVLSDGTSSVLPLKPPR